MLPLYTNLNRKLAGTVKYPASDFERQLFCYAIDAALKSEQRFRVGAVAVDGAGLLKSGSNNYLQHAEKVLISGRTHQMSLDGMTVAVARLGKKNDWRCSYPCDDCHRALKNAGVKRVVCIDEYHALVSVNL